jgi:GNAT superfamily N-acetyltransferase
MPVIEIKPFYAGQEFIISQLIKEVYDEFVAPDYTTEGNMFFYAFIKPEAMRGRQEKQISILLASVNDALAGMIEMRDNNHVSLLFTRKEFHGQGIARKLFREAVRICQSINPGLDCISVHASLYSIPIYQRLGFTTTSPMQEANGIIYLPMEMRL